MIRGTQGNVGENRKADKINNNRSPWVYLICEIISVSKFILFVSSKIYGNF